MKDYEAVFILRSTLGPEKTQEEIEKLKEVIKKQEGVIQEEVKWGNRTLAYSIKNKREGFYVLLYFQLDPSRVKSILHTYGLMTDEVLRVMIVEKQETPKTQKVASGDAAAGPA
ncbi:MAG TPA: 30S ribosomal protein S6 [Candidatus Omnitrophota bacterium]|nr:30S ribosomal protein S6 [Candidatus Omnitrophota bacterium]